MIYKAAGMHNFLCVCKQFMSYVKHFLIFFHVHVFYRRMGFPKALPGGT